MIQYFKYAFIGAIVALFAIVTRELIGRVLPQTRFNYVLSILIVYTIGIFLSFELQQKFTFNKIDKDKRKSKIFAFFVIAILIAILSSSLSYYIRYYMNIDEYINKEFSAGLSFSISVVFCSVLSFILNKKIIFNED